MTSHATLGALREPRAKPSRFVRRAGSTRPWRRAWIIPPPANERARGARVRARSAGRATIRTMNTRTLYDVHVLQHMYEYQL